ncbi:MAG: NAD(P)H-hydrate dehydratase [Gemmatimonadota bacterium]|nr:NAD(P)H-hydrate dehydratase [Gemmatimonadota bacterium]
MTVRVTTAAQAAAMDERAIQAGTASYDLMRAAASQAVEVICARMASELRRGVTVFVGVGNNGGDGYVAAANLAAKGIAVRVVACGDPRTADAQRAARELRAGIVVEHSPLGVADAEAPGVVVDALLGTGARGEPRDEVKDAILVVNALRARGARVVSLDVPSGLDATTGLAAGECVRADLTVTFGSVKRGLLRDRDASGAIVAVDIGLGSASDDPTAPALIGAAQALGRVPRIPADANKGTRRRLLIVGGAGGMAGATILAARGALRSGVGMVKVCVESPSIAPVQAAVPAALTTTWPSDEAQLAEQLGWAHCVLLGPGLGLGKASRDLALSVLTKWRGPVVVDADALTAFEGNTQRLGELLAGRPAVITPHAVEAQRLAGVAAADLDAGRFEAADRLADRVKATVLLKGVPTVISNGILTQVVATGTPVLATGGSGDVLGGIVATLLAQTGDPLASASSAAWVHGRAAEIAGAGAVRGVVLDDVVEALRFAWVQPATMPAGVLVDLAAATT